MVQTLQEGIVSMEPPIQTAPIDSLKGANELFSLKVNSLILALIFLDEEMYASPLQLKMKWILHATQPKGLNPSFQRIKINKYARRNFAIMQFCKSIRINA